MLSLFYVWFYFYDWHKVLTVKKQNEKDKKQMKAKGGEEEKEKEGPLWEWPGSWSETSL